MDDGVFQRKHTAINASVVITPGHHIRNAHEWCPRILCHNANSNIYFLARRSTGLKIRSVHAVQWTTSTKPFAFDVTLEELHHGGFAGMRLGEAQTQDSAHEEPCPRRTRIEQLQEARTTR